jgi:hypothetical protein
MSDQMPHRSGPTLGDVLAKVSVSTAIAVLGLVLAAIGSIGAWATVFGLFSVDGTAGDGRITLGLAAFGVVALLVGRGASLASALAALVALAVVAVAIVDLVDLSHVSGPTLGHAVSAGWGLYAVLAGGIIAVGAIASEANVRLTAPPVAQLPTTAQLSTTIAGNAIVLVGGVAMVASVVAVHVFGV